MAWPEELSAARLPLQNTALVELVATDLVGLHVDANGGCYWLDLHGVRCLETDAPEGVMPSRVTRRSLLGLLRKPPIQEE